LNALKNPKTLLTIALLLIVMIGSVKLIPVELPHIQVAPEAVFTLGPLVFTNTFLALLVSDLVLLGLAFVAGRNMQLVPGGLQNFFEAIYEFWYNTAVGHLGEKLAKTWLPLALTVFLTIWFSNYLHFLPSFDSIGYFCQAPNCIELSAAKAPEAGKPHAAEEHKPLNIQWTGGAAGQGIGLIQKSVKPAKAEAGAAAPAPEPAHADGDYVFVPFLRVAASDLNFTLALALIAFFCIEFAGFKQLGGGYITKFLNFREGPMNLIVGLLEAFSEVMRIVTFSFRLFGNVFAGQTMLFVFPFLIPLMVALPIYGLELFVGLIQAYVFAVLILAFMEQAITSHHAPDAEHAH
jgi:F-type H+-transporting ATPase subunit a